jgi:hypothetical protein
MKNKQSKTIMQNSEWLSFEPYFIPFCTPPQNKSYKVTVPILESIEGQYGNLVDMQINAICHPVKRVVSKSGKFWYEVTMFPKTLEGNSLFMEIFPN